MPVVTAALIKIIFNLSMEFSLNGTGIQRI